PRRRDRILEAAARLRDHLHGPWVPDGERLINPTLGGADGGEVGNWGRVHPYGGIFDPASGRWSALPNPPDGEEDFGSGVLTGSGGHYFGYRGWILDTTTNEWIELPPLDTDQLVTGRTVVPADDDLVVFGGARWKEHSFEATLLADAWIWSPRASIGAEASDQPPVAGSSGAPAEGLVSVPDVVGLSEGDAVKVLGASGLVANVRYARDAPRTTNVLHSDPEAGTDLAADSVVVLSIALAPRLPLPGQEHEGEIIPLGSLVEDNPDAFVGLYSDEAGIRHVVFGPGVDPESWEARLMAAAKGITYPAEGIGYRTDTCSRDRASLRAIQYEIAPAGRSTKWWTENQRLAFGVWVHSSTCTVRVESDLLAPADIQALVGRYGTAISFDTSEGSAGTLLPLID
ncbi:MAG: PASTA domain-containing protein, partial [Gaiellaceae bacterium]